MKLQTLQAAISSALVVLSATPADASHAHRHLHYLERRHTLEHVHRSSPIHSELAGTIAKRGGNCQFPSDDGNLVAVTPNAQNAGWAMSPDQPCLPGSWCPYACAPGMVMAQWDPDSTYTYPQSMNGGLYCRKDGTISKPFPNKPYCVAGTGAVKAVNKCSKPLTFCQTVLPGNEAMLIPTLVDSIATIAVPDINYWQKTAAHFYINPPGSGVADCIWGTDGNPIGNWSPFVAGANTDASGQTFVKIAYNPVWESSGLKSKSPNFGVKIECPLGGCNGLPCSISPGGGDVKSDNVAVGAGNSAFCVVTVAKGKTAHIVAFDGSGGHSSAPETKPAEKPAPAPVKSQAPPPPPPTSAAAPVPATTSVKAPSSEAVVAPSSVQDAAPTVLPGIFHENSNSSSSDPSQTSTQAPQSSKPASTTPAVVDKKGEAGRQQGSAAFAGLVVAFVAAACFF